MKRMHTLSTFSWVWAFAGLLVGLATLCLGQPAAAEPNDTARLAAWTEQIQKKEQKIAAKLVSPPEGKRYESEVPDTLDLADRARLAINCLTGALDPDYGYEMYFVARFSSNPPFMHHEASGLPTNNPKFAESLPMMRLMSGSAQNLDIERGMIQRMLALIGDDGLYYAPLTGRPWHHDWDRADDDFANIYGNSRFLLAMMAWYQYDGNPIWKHYIQEMISGLRKVARFEGDMAYFPDPKIGESFSYPRSGYPPDLPEPTDIGFGIHMYHSGVVRALSKWAEMTGDKDTLDFARKLANWLSQPKLWAPEAQPAHIVGPERGHFSGHFHAHVASLRGLMVYAIVANDQSMKEFVRNGYEYARNFGVSRIGWFPEGTNGDGATRCEACCTADMVALAIKLADAGVGDYWEDVDRYARNQLVEQQLIDKSLLEKCAAASGPHKASPPKETDDRVIDRNLGGWAGYADMSTCPSTWIMHCCTGNASQALYYAWEGIVRNLGNGTAQVNLLLNRASPWLDIDSYLPHEGKVVIKNKAAKRLLIRVPNWVSRRDVRCRVGRKSVANIWNNNYLVLDGLKPNDRIVVEFPMVEATEKVTLCGVNYTLRLRGNTVVNVSPRNNTPWYPTYRRENLLRTTAPMVRKMRYVLDRHIED
ncbi:MAG: glycoside hydrolase family 127 protein [Armatimonadetes bacterium]|nr:glycoside hydrolase family 127 protein [Armatimonadota bacterium]